MTTPQAIQSVYTTYTTLQGANEEQSEAFFLDYLKKFGPGNALTNACLMAFEINAEGPDVDKLRAALVELNQTGKIEE